jgi:hypothetical protein
MEMTAPGSVVQVTTPGLESDKHCGNPDAGAVALKGIAAGVMGMKDNAESPLNLNDVTVDASDHCRVNSQTGDAGGFEQGDSNQTASIAAHSVVKPCPSECGSGATGSGLRRPVDAATLAQNARPKPISVRKHQHDSWGCLILSACREHIRPRGPPVCIS